ncbi:restriction endonuclease subunit S [Streptococcus pseudopneumoniae]|uniref:restriction endonuclease subunit S n=1 Tax=Streptococcus pseudopneumoniae TaxID=257758 RepID=UPI00141A52E6|nr:restriction endonuclease subunit S [Streptococcus pseudopneumoniae]NIB97006.1 restriction endonuclease subunit S [Streptococcus pseudopneumoniae]
MKKVKLGELVSIQTGKLDANAAVVGGKYPFFTTAKEILWINDYVYDDEVVLVAGNGDLNVKYYKGKFNAYQRTYILSNNSNVKMKYLYYFLDKYIEILRYQSIGGVIKYIKFNNLSNALVPMMSVSEQENIIQNFEKIDYLISKRSQQYTELSNLVKSRFNEMFEEYPDSVFLDTYIKELRAGKSLAGEENNKNKVLKTGAVSYDYFNSSEVKNLPIDYIPLDEHKVEIGDVIISRMNTSELVGAAGYVWAINSDNIYLPDRLWKVILNDRVNPVFLWKLITNEKTKLKIKGIASGTSGSMKNISKSKFLQIRVPLPPLALQNEFADFVAQVDKSQFACEIAIKVWRNSLKFSII